MFPDLETLTHPWEEVRQRIVPTLDTLGNTSTSARERQCTNAIRPDDYVGICLGKANLRRENIGRTFFGAATRYFAIPKEL